MKRILLLALLLIGCGGLSSRAARYLKDSDPYQKGLGQYQVELRQIPSLPPEQRGPQVKALLAKVQASHQALTSLEVPSSMASLHGELNALYDILEKYCQALLGSQTGHEANLQQLSQDWAKHQAQLQAEVEKLGQ